MKILYYNLQLGCFDGSNSHALGMLKALRRIYGEGNVVVANQQQRQTYHHAAAGVKAKLGPLIDVPRLLRKNVYAKRASAQIVASVRESGFEPDVLLARSTLYDYAPIEVARELGCQLVTEANTPLEYECCDLRHASLRVLVRSFERDLYEASDGIYAVSNTLKDMLVMSCGVAESKIKVVPNGYSADLYSDFDARDDVRSRVRAEEGFGDAFLVAFIGSLQTWHGVERLVAVADAVRAKGGRRTVFLVLGDGANRELVEGRARGADDFRWFGNVEQRRMRELLYASDLGIMPYENIEHFYFSPLKMYDMIGAGLPYIGLRIGQIEEESPGAIKADCLLDSLEPEAYAVRIVEIRDGNELPGIKSSAVDARRHCTWDARACELSHWLEKLVESR